MPCTDEARHLWSRLAPGNGLARGREKKGKGEWSALGEHISLSRLLDARRHR